MAFIVSELQPFLIRAPPCVKSSLTVLGCVSRSWWSQDEDVWTSSVLWPPGPTGPNHPITAHCWHGSHARFRGDISDRLISSHSHLWGASAALVLISLQASLLRATCATFIRTLEDCMTLANQSLTPDIRPPERVITALRAVTAVLKSLNSCGGFFHSTVVVM